MLHKDGNKCYATQEACELLPFATNLMYAIEQNGNNP